jgi:hypothetical protein
MDTFNLGMTLGLRGQTRAQRQGEFTVTTWVSHCDWPIKNLGTCLVFFRVLP